MVTILSRWVIKLFLHYMIIYFRLPLNTFQQEHRSGIDHRHVPLRLEFCVQNEVFPFKTPD
jgi:hypothetical protein